MTIIKKGKGDIDASLLVDTSMDIDKKRHKRNPFGSRYIQLLQTPIHKVSCQAPFSAT